MLERRSANLMLLAEELRGTGELRTDLSDREVADIVGSTSAVDYHLYLARRGWSPQDYERLLVDLWTRLLLSGSPLPPESAGPPDSEGPLRED